MKNIGKLIINSLYFEPQQYLEYIMDTREFVLQTGLQTATFIA